ncbi:hypothetical protein [Burkholderia vietnamiensis]|uniref:hypothetical protein n=2 Tax=Burkholderia vietnamiensis TaxID=60552 RepID=UPI002658B9E2|nr:hypothetical protein [Burkholderia vietnamiensis]
MTEVLGDIAHQRFGMGALKLTERYPGCVQRAVVLMVAQIGEAAIVPPCIDFVGADHIQQCHGNFPIPHALGGLAQRHAPVDALSVECHKPASEYRFHFTFPEWLSDFRVPANRRVLTRKSKPVDASTPQTKLRLN